MQGGNAKKSQKKISSEKKNEKSYEKKSFQGFYFSNIRVLLQYKESGLMPDVDIVVRNDPESVDRKTGKHCGV